ncbi:hypothetical protein [Vibrio crassostreae]|uniref:hypothetical protein n=1 Tax=Vibrio crassostreae TaxID=246167 RepID=UPI001B3020FF|nr:hypothetical protein [Vibrio crassostreae]
MNSPILELLPAIHVTIVGIFAAIVSAFAIWAFQKQFEAESKLKKALTEAKQLSTPSSIVIIGGNENNLLTEDGLLDWEGVGRDVLFRNKSLFSYLDNKDKYGLNNSNNIVPTDQKILKAGDELMHLFYHFFNTYPFTGNSIVHMEGITDKVEEQKKRPFTIDQLQQMSSRVSFVCWCWQTNHLSILELFKRYTAIKQAEEVEERDKLLKETLQKMPKDIPEELIAGMTKHHDEFPLMNTNYVDVATHFFERIHEYQRSVVPALTEVVNEYKVNKEHFRIKERGLIFIRFTTFILLCGVCLPLILLEWLNGAELFNWHSLAWGWIEHLILLGTMAPYFYAFYKTYKYLNEEP